MSYYSDAVIRDGAIAYWRLGESSGTIANDSIGTNHGTIDTGIVLGQAGALLADNDKSMLFNGAGQKINTGTITTSPSQSWELWIKTPSFGERSVLSNRGSTAGAYKFVLIIEDLGRLYVYSESGSTPLTSSISINQWYHVVYVVHTTGSYLYVNGVQAASASHPAFASITEILTIGSDLGGGPASFIGNIDEVAVYPTALTASQIANHYNLSKLSQFPANSYPDKVIKDGAVAYWRLGETSGITAVDIIGGNNGTISGGVTLGQAGSNPSDSDKAMRFDGVDDQINFPSGTVASYKNIGSGSASLEFWFKTSMATKQTFPIMPWDGEIGVITYVGGITFSVDPFAGTPGETFPVTALVNYNDDRWHHLVGVLERGSTDKIKVYCDGILANSLNLAAGTTFPGSTNGTIFGAYPGPGYHFEGFLDEIAYYHVALTPQQILDHYNSAQVVTYIGNKSIPLGSVINLTQGEAYALPSRGTHLTSTAPVEVSMDGTVFSSLTNADTVGARCSAKFIRSLSASCSLIIK